MKNIIRLLIASFWFVVMLFSVATMIAAFKVFLNRLDVCYTSLYANEMKYIILLYTVCGILEIWGLSLLMYSSQFFTRFLYKALPELKNPKCLRISYKESNTMICQVRKEREDAPCINCIREPLNTDKEDPDLEDHYIHE